MNKIFTLIRNMYFKCFDEAFPLTLQDIINSNEKAQTFTNYCKQMDIHNEELLEFIKDQSYAAIIRQQLLT